MKLQRKDWFIIFGEILLFLFILPVMWLDEYINLRSIFPWAPPVFYRFQEYIIETSLILIIAISVITSTVIILKKIRRFERFMRVCAWCRKVWVDGKWVNFENYALSKHSLKSSHGICDECMTGFKMVKKETKDGKSLQIKTPFVFDKGKKHKPFH